MTCSKVHIYIYTSPSEDTSRGIELGILGPLYGSLALKSYFCFCHCPLTTMLCYFRGCNRLGGSHHLLPLWLSRVSQIRPRNLPLSSGCLAIKLKCKTESRVKPSCSTPRRPPNPFYYSFGSSSRQIVRATLMLVRFLQGAELVGQAVLSICWRPQ
jgi:hypothetical protein